MELVFEYKKLYALFNAFLAWGLLAVCLSFEEGLALNLFILGKKPQKGVGRLNRQSQGVAK